MRYNENKKMKKKIYKFL